MNAVARQFVTPAKAGVQGKRLKSMDSRLRGNDGTSDVALISTILSQALSGDDLKEIGIVSVGHRRRLLEAISALTV